MVEHPEIQARMQKEATEAVGAGGMMQALEDAERLNYLEAVTHETMRLKPVAPVLFLEPIDDAQIGDVAVPKGTSLMLLTMHSPLQDAHFTGANQFRPDRWIEEEKKSGDAHNARAFVPFGAGPRFCPGRHLAMVEIKMTMSMLCGAFEISKADHPEPVGEIFSFTMMPQNLFVKFRRRVGI